jgi:hypothetical protein
VRLGFEARALRLIWDKSSAHIAIKLALSAKPVNCIRGAGPSEAASLIARRVVGITTEEVLMGSMNVGNIDRAVRVAIGLVLLAMTVLGAIGPWGYVGVVPLLTGLVARCPLYSLLGISTCPR